MRYNLKNYHIGLFYIEVCPHNEWEMIVDLCTKRLIQPSTDNFRELSFTGFYF